MSCDFCSAFVSPSGLRCGVEAVVDGVFEDAPDDTEELSLSTPPVLLEAVELLAVSVLLLTAGTVACVLAEAVLSGCDEVLLESCVELVDSPVVALLLCESLLVLDASSRRLRRPPRRPRRTFLLVSPRCC